MSVFSDTNESVAAPETKTNSEHILIVEDDYEIAESIKYALSSNGFQVSVARDGNEGIAIAETSQPDLMVLDMMMPKRSGLLVLERLRQHGGENPCPIIMITGNEGARHRAYAELLGVNDYLHKPFTMDRLIDSIKRLLKEK